MKLVCPKCHLRLTLPTDKVPAAGAWAVCPRCQERFFIKPGALPLDNLTRPRPAAPANPGAPGGAPRGRDQASQRLLESMKNKRGLKDELPPFDPGLITVYPRPARSDTPYRALGGLLLGLLVLGIVVLFRSAASRQAASLPAPPPATALARVNNWENEESIRKDMVNIRRDLNNRRRGMVNIEHSGPEARVFKYFMGRLTPDVCSGIYRLALTPMDSPAGFKATGYCLEPEDRRLEMRVEWAGRYGIVSFPDYRQTEELELYPLPEAGPATPAAAGAGSQRRP